MIFAAITLPELAPILTIFVGMLGGFYVLVRFILTLSEKTAEADRKERQELSKAIAEMAEAMQQVAVSNERIADESKARNGHLAEISVQNKDQIVTEIRGLTIEKQTVHNQVVEHEQVISKE
jgi:flagellar biosynthesis/type III secretory pathway chaperone